MPPGKLRTDLNCRPLAVHQLLPPYSPQAERALAGQVRAQQRTAQVSTGNSVLPAASVRTRGFPGVMRKDQVGSISRQAPGPHQSVCGLSHPAYSKTGTGRGCPSGVPQEGAQDIPPPSAPLSDKSTLIQAQASSWGSVQPSQSSRVPSRW